MTSYDEACATYEAAQEQTGRVVDQIRAIHGPYVRVDTHLAYVMAGAIEDLAFDAWREAFKINWKEALGEDLNGA